jgi:hypothetical protein
MRLFVVDPHFLLEQPLRAAVLICGLHGYSQNTDFPLLGGEDSHQYDSRRSR